MLELLLRPLADAFLQVGVFVALLVLPFGWARVRWGHRLEAALRRHRRLGPVVAALLTAPPGCGGAILVMGTYSRGAVSYGAAIAALVATSGDAAWVLLVADPVLAVQLKVLLVVTGASTGLLVDTLGINPALRRDRARVAVPAGSGLGSGVGDDGRDDGGDGAAAAAPDVVVPPALADPPLGGFALVLWVTLGAGLLVALPTTFRVVDPSAGGSYLVLGLLGGGLCVAGFLRGRGRLADDGPDDACPTSMTQVLRHGAHEVAFITTWVAIAFLGWQLVSTGVGLDAGHLPLAGAVGVLVGAAVGLVPGCGLQVVFVGVFLAGGMPLPTLVANAVSQDGDALIPLLALEQRPALLAVVLTTVPAVVVGLALLLLT